jgi:hypothetical protein
MTRKDYVRIAERLKHAYARLEFAGERHGMDAAIEAFIELGHEDNPQFDADKFRSACHE